MQWCGEVRPEPAMIPDLGVFLRSAPAYSQAVAAREQNRVSPAQRTEKPERRREPFPARLKLPFLLSPGGENRALAPDQKEQALQ
jgi:hypothetical protein